MKKKKEMKNIGHRGDVKDVMRNYELQMRMVRKAEKLFYSHDGGLKNYPAPSKS